MIDRLDEGKWDHFADREYFRQLLQSGGDVLLVGNPHAGKKTLLAELKVDRNVSIECSIVRTSAGVQHELLQQLVAELSGSEQKFYPRSFEGALRWARAAGGGRQLFVVFKNAESFFQRSAEEFRLFFGNYRGFAEAAAREAALRLQTIVLSRVDLPLPYPRCCLAYPADAQLRRFLAARAARLAAKRHVHAQLPPRLNQFVARCSALELYFKHFDAMAIIADRLLAVLVQDFTAERGGNYELAAQFCLNNCIRLFDASPRSIYCSQSALNDMAERHAANVSAAQSAEQARVEAFDEGSALCAGLPGLAKCALLAVAVCQHYTQRSDAPLMSAAKRSAHRGLPVRLNKRPSKEVHCWRVWNMLEMLLCAATQRADGMEEARAFHSNEFYLCFDFLERVGLIACGARRGGEAKYRVTCDMLLLKKVKAELGFTTELALDAAE